MASRLSHIPQGTGRLLSRCLFSLAIFLLLIRVLQFDGPDVVMDDAFISFRYAMNLARGLGPVYNPGERVEGYTSFLWVVLLAICHGLGMDIIVASKALALLSATGTIAVLFLFQKRTVNQEGQKDLLIWAFPAVLFAAMGSHARYVTSGMETLLFTFLLSAATYVYLYSDKPFFAGLAFALLSLTRPEGLLYFALALGCHVVTTYQDPRALWLRYILHFVGGFFVLYGSYFLWRYSYYGYLLPNTFYAKVGGLYWARIQRGWNLFRQVMRWWSLWPILGLSSLELGLQWAGFRTLKPTAKKRLFFFTMAILTTISYFIFVGGDFIVWFGPRFLIPVLPMLLLVSSTGIRRISSFPSIPTLPQKSLKWILWVALFFNAWWLSWPARFFSKEAFSVQMRGWAEMGRWIAANTPRDATIATDAAGLIPFYSERYSIDMFGLTDPYIAHMNVPITEQSIVAHEKYDPEYILQRRPDYIVSTWMDSTGQAISAGLPLVGEKLRQCYELIAVAKIRHGAPANGQWIIVTSYYSSNLYEQGYVTGLFQRKCSP